MSSRSKSKTKKRVSPKFIKGAIKTIKDFRACKLSNCGAEHILDADFDKLKEEADYKACDKIAFNPKYSLKEVNDCYAKTKYNIEAEKYKGCVNDKCSKLKKQFEKDNKYLLKVNTNSFSEIMNCEKAKCVEENKKLDEALKVCNSNNKLTTSEYNKCRKKQGTKKLVKNINKCSKKKCRKFHKADAELLKSLQPYYTEKYPKKLLNKEFNKKSKSKKRKSSKSKSKRKTPLKTGGGVVNHPLTEEEVVDFKNKYSKNIASMIDFDTTNDLSEIKKDVSGIKEKIALYDIIYSETGQLSKASTISSIWYHGTNEPDSNMNNVNSSKLSETITAGKPGTHIYVKKYLEGDKKDKVFGIGKFITN